MQIYENEFSKEFFKCFNVACECPDPYANEKDANEPISMSFLYKLSCEWWVDTLSRQETSPLPDPNLNLHLT